jgi:hypothetical protein
MRTFKEFLELTERYYEPNERLPSGETPVGKAEKRAETEYKNTKYGRGRQIRQGIQLNRKVRHGADNPTINRHSQSDIEVNAGSDGASFYHPDTKIRYDVYKHGKTDDGKNVYGVAWNHHQSSNLDSNQRKQVARDARNVWNTHVQHRLPYGSVLKNSPVENPTKDNPRKNTRAKLYQRAGFGEVGISGSQFASVGREPSWKRRGKGAKRLKPMSGNTPFKYT